MNTELDVFVVQVGPTGLWEADCCNTHCGHGLHGVAEGLPSRGEAEKAATEHRRHLRARIAEENERWARMAADGDPVALEVVRWRKQALKAQAELAAYRQLYGPLPEE